nr:unnamed protein product [Callosobruchus chinensis]
MAEATGTEIMLARDMVPEYYGTNFRPTQQRPSTSLPTPMSVDRSSVRTSTQPRPNYFQGNGKPSFIVEELHNQDEPFVGDDSHETDYEHL